MRISTTDALAVLDGRVVQRATLPATLSISTDTRAIRPSETFLALRGEHYDGHAFAADAFARGASAVVVDDAAAIPAGCAGIVVADTLVAYLSLARLARDRVLGTVFGITGSTGKTTTKAMMLQAFAAAGIPAAGTPANDNNEIGVAKFLLGLEDRDARRCVIEMGCRHYRDLDPLVAAAQPDIAVLANIGEAHLEVMGSRERLAETKWAIFDTGARAVLNCADAVSIARAPSLPSPPVWFGTDAERVAPGVEAVIVTPHDVIVMGRATPRTISFENDLPGEHNRRNCAAALAAVHAGGVDLGVVLANVRRFETPSGRYERILMPIGATIVFDAYNASLTGTLASLAAFAVEPAQRRIAVLGSMAELGDDSAAMHAEVGTAAASVADVILAGGAFAEETIRGANAAGATGARIVRYRSNDDAVAWLQRNVRAGDAILLKGSRVYKMEQILAGLRA